MPAGVFPALDPKLILRTAAWLTVASCSAPVVTAPPASVHVQLIVNVPPPPPAPPRAQLAAPWQRPTCPARRHASTRVFVQGSADEGLREIDGTDGSLLRVLSRTPADHPRWIGQPATAIAFVEPGRHEIRAISLTDCTERVVATLPRDLGLSCRDAWDRPYDPVEALHAEDDVESDGAGGLCLRLMDRVANMANAIVAVRVDLATGALTHQMVVGDGCAPAGGISPRDESPCATTLRTAWSRWAHRAGGPARTGDRTQPFAIERGRVVQRGTDRRHDRVVMEPAATDLAEETVSPSGRYAVVHANPDVGDAIYRDLILFDRQDGTFHPLRASASWPAALTREQFDDDDAMRGLWCHATAETTVRWLGDGDQLIVAGLLVDPERAIVRVGTVAW